MTFYIAKQRLSMPYILVQHYRNLLLFLSPATPHDHKPPAPTPSNATHKAASSPHPASHSSASRTSAGRRNPLQKAPHRRSKYPASPP